VRATVGQRLLPVCCPHCLVPDPAGAASLEALDLAGATIEPKTGTGCDRCNGRGILGATAVFELFELTASIQQMILEGGSRAELAGEARKGGMVSLRQRALDLVAEGKVRVRDALRVGDV
jgi:type IV pilus assembly protein PilB